MRGNELSFHIAREAGLEFVFTSGRALTYPMHTHVSVYTITVVRKGSVALRRGDSVDAYGPGSVYTVAPHEPHSPSYSDGFDIVSLCLDKEKARHSSLPAIVDVFLSHAAPFVDRKALAATEVRLLAGGIAAVHDSPGDAGRCETSPDILLAEPFIDPYRFIRRFKKETGLTPHQYRIQSRIRAAKKLLVAPVSLSDVAAMAGFYDQSHLNRWFNKALGITPNEYKNSCRIIRDL